MPAGISHSSGTRPWGSGALGTGTMSTVPRTASTEASQPGVPSSCDKGVTGLAAGSACWEATGGGALGAERSTGHDDGGDGDQLSRSRCAARQNPRLARSRTAATPLAPIPVAGICRPDMGRRRHRCDVGQQRRETPLPFLDPLCENADPIPRAPAIGDAARHPARPARIRPPAHRLMADRPPRARLARVAALGCSRVQALP